jgi:para-aminobenzoate synthetase component 1
MSAPVPVLTPLVDELIPCPDPWDVARRLAHLPHLLFLDSAERHPQRGRYSYVMADPYKVWHQAPVGTMTAAAAIGGDPFGPLQDDWPRLTTLPGLPPFQGGFAGVFSYELGRHFERLPLPRVDEFQFPALTVGGYDWVIAFDHAQNRAWIVSTGLRPGSRYGSETAARRLQRVLSELRRDPPTSRSAEGSPLKGGLSVRNVKRPERTATPSIQYPLHGFPGVTSNFSRDGYIAAVRRAVEYIHAGDCFQVNLSQRLITPLREHPLDLYGRLRTRNPAPFACYFDAGDFQIVSASPEQFLQVSPTGEVVTRPIKGTRRRGRSSEEDAALMRELTVSVKDRAENVMIVDLLRNDLGRVCEYGSVRVPRVCEVETYRYVHHLVSEVRGRLRPGQSAFDGLRAAFPGGSVTGAPKVRAMEIIAELEPTARGPYCGGVGFIGFNGTMDTNILIRTFTASRGWLQFPVGGGIVADSEPQAEYEETLHKAAGLLRALEG